MKIRVRVINSIIIASVLCIVALFLSNNMELLAVISIFVFLLNFLALKRINSTYITISSIMLILIYFFNCGQQLVDLFGYIDIVKKSENMILILSESELIKSTLFCMFSMTLFTFGASCSGTKEVQPRVDNKMVEIDEIQCRTIFNIGLVLFLLSVGPRLYIDFIKWGAYVSGAYIDAMTINVPGWVSLLSTLFLYSIILMLIGSINRKKRARTILWMSIFYMIICMLKGTRGQQVISIAVLILLYYKLIKTEKTKLSKLVIVAFVGYILLVFINAVGSVRSSGFVITVPYFVEILRDNSPISMLMKFMSELGGTVKNMGYAIRYIPSSHPYNMGINYIAGLASIYPNIGGLLGNTVNYYSYLSAFPKDVTQFMGGSILGEAYVNFGPVVGVIFLGFVGYIVNKISFSFEEECAYKSDLYRLSIIMALVPNMLLWTRDYFYCMVFQFFWMWLLISLVRRRRIN